MPEGANRNVEKMRKKACNINKEIESNCCQKYLHAESEELLLTFRFAVMLYKVLVVFPTENPGIHEV